MPEEAKVSKAQQKAVNKYVKNNYDRINVTFPKGQKELIKAHAQKHNESVNIQSLQIYWCKYSKNVNKLLV